MLRNIAATSKTMPVYYDKSPGPEHATLQENKTAGKRIGHYRKIKKWSGVPIHRSKPAYFWTN
ncbi:MAG: hypothetical protein KH291_08905, partial [Collinsella sp.]|nr:hypothetical protein [Collinsella sp.]